MLLCDLSKVLDCVSHLLQEKMDGMSIRGLCLNLFKWQQAIYFNGEYLEFHVSQRGVPQGSVLGLATFLIYVKDFYNYISSIKCTMFADDTTLVVSDSKIEHLLGNITLALNRALTWFNINSLQHNIEKTQ